MKTRAEMAAVLTGATDEVRASELRQIAAMGRIVALVTEVETEAETARAARMADIRWFLDAARDALEAMRAEQQARQDTFLAAFGRARQAPTVQ